jgi:hypothetical protein
VPEDHQKMAVLDLPQLCVLQTAGDDQDIQRHRRRDAKYNHVFHVLLSSLFGFEWEAPP